MHHCLDRAHKHHGTSFVEVYQNCNIFNDGAFADFTSKEVRADRTILLEHGKPMIFGKERNKGLRFNGMRIEVVEVGVDGVTEADLLVHDETRDDPTIAFLLSRMEWPEYPVPMGVFRAVQRPTYDGLMTKQIEEVIAAEGEGELRDIFLEGDTWTVE
jgi:2-oxoglutarate ferredoxin oxidoreductase subunit beta